MPGSSGNFSGFSTGFYPGGSDGAYPFGEGGALIIVKGDALFGTTTSGGSSDSTNPYCQGGACGTVFKLTPPQATQTAWTETTLWTFTGGTDGAVPLAGLVADNSGARYGTTADGGDVAVGLAYATEATVSEDLRDGRLIRVLEEWCPPHPGFFIYYPSKRQLPSGLRALIDHIKI